MSERLFSAVLSCSDCGEVLNTAAHVPESKRGLVGVQSGLVAPPCPKGCRSTLSDLNLNTHLVWSEEAP